MESFKVLLIEDNPGDARLIREYLADARNISFDLQWKSTLAEGLSSLSEHKPDVVLLDLGLPDSPNRAASFTRTQSVAPTVPIVVLTGFDEETFAVTTVRRGAQDYLLKGKINTETLVRTIRYAIARRLGGERRFTPAELGQYTGKDGTAAFIAYKGRVYDVSNSRFWKGGTHLRVHLAGNDLTDGLARAPHGEENLLRMPAIGELVQTESLQQRLLARIESLHLHPTSAHFAVSYAPMAFIFSLVWLFAGQVAFEAAAFYLLWLGFVAIIVSGGSGLLSWIVSYESKTTRVFNQKIALSILLFIIMLGTLTWRLTSYEVVLTRPASFIYLASFVTQVLLVAILDKYGKEVVYS